MSVTCGRVWNSALRFRVVIREVESGAAWYGSFYTVGGVCVHATNGWEAAFLGVGE